MKKLFFLLLALPLGLVAQDDQPETVFQNVIITVNQGEADEFEAKVAEHNKAFHQEGAYGSRVYNIVTGPNAGKYIWNMGPTPWASLDDRPGEGDHDDSWETVMQHAHQDVHVSYWAFDTEHSYFPSDFDLDKLQVMYVDVKRNKWKEVAYLMQKVKAVFAEMPDQPYGVYWNETPSTAEGRDMALIWFFDSWGWMGEDPGFTEKFNEMNGDGAWDRWMDDWVDATNGTETEFWVFREDLSGISGKVAAAERQ